jgi:hypothetical protein
MIDHPETTRRALDALEACLPFEARLAPRVIQALRAQDPSRDLPARYVVRDLSYAGDEGGIMCHLDGGEGKPAIVTSLTQLLVPPSVPAAAAAARYQKHRIKRLKKLGG